jgi:beta-N-acetylhexosaminidase
MPARDARALLAVVMVLAVVGCSGPAPRWQPPGATTAPPASGSPTVAPSPTATSSTPTESDCVDPILAAMSLKAMAGQVLMLGTPIGNPASINPAVTTFQLGGVFLAGRSQQSAATLKAAISALQANGTVNGIRLQIALDQEGGQVQTLQGPDFPPIPTAVEQGRESASTLRANTATWSRRLAAIGVTLDLAPVADTVPAWLGAGNPPIGAYERQYGSDPDTVAADIAVVVSAIQSNGVLTTLKHFPGLGRVRRNTDTSTGAVDLTATTADPYLDPFASGIKAGTGAVMVSSASYPKLDDQNIAAFSRAIVTDLLRGQLGFTGMIVSDDLGNAVAVSGVPVGDRAVRFIQAGGDLVLTVQPADAGPMTRALIAKAEASDAFRSQLRAAARYVLAAKYRVGLLPCSPKD